MERIIPYTMVSTFAFHTCLNTAKKGKRVYHCQPKKNYSLNPFPSKKIKTPIHSPMTVDNNMTITADMKRLNNIIDKNRQCVTAAQKQAGR